MNYFKNNRYFIAFTIGISLLADHSLIGMDVESASVQPLMKNLKTATDPDDFMDESTKAIPERPLTYDALYTIFKDLLLPPTKDLFEQYFAIMFKGNFPPPVHKDSVIVAGYQCLFRKMSYALVLKGQEQADYQADALFKLLAFHKTSIGKFNENLADKIPAFACESCKRSAKTEVGIVDQGKIEGYGHL